MKKLQVLGPGCPNCTKLAMRVDEAARALGLDYALEKVTDMDEILAFDIASTPALVVDGAVKVSGRVPSAEEIKEMIG